MSEQLELEMPRRRAVLAEAEQQGSGDPWLDAMTKRRPRVKLLKSEREALNDSTEYSSWFKAEHQRPWQPGFYDIHVLGTEEYYRIWYDDDYKGYGYDAWVLPTGVFRHEDIKGTIEWRGRAKPLPTFRFRQGLVD